MTTQTLSAILSVSIITISAPILILILWCYRKKAKVMPALAGAIVFLIFSQILEMIPHMFFLFTDNPVSRVITSVPILYALYTGLVAGIFGNGSHWHCLHRINSPVCISNLYGE